MNDFDTSEKDTVKDSKPEEKKILIKVYNREQARRCDKLGILYDRVKQTPITNETKREFKQYRRELAKGHGSKTGELKKKHINRDRVLNEYLKENLK